MLRGAAVLCCVVGLVLLLVEMFMSYHVIGVSISVGSRDRVFVMLMKGTVGEASVTCEA